MVTKVKCVCSMIHFISLDEVKSITVHVYILHQYNIIIIYWYNIFNTMPHPKLIVSTV